MSTSPSAPVPASTPDPASEPATRDTVASPGTDEPVVVRSCEDLVAAVPYLVGFPPEHSLVLVSLRRRGSRLRLGLVARFDLPDSGSGPRGRVPAAVHELVEQAVQVVLRDEPEQVVALVFDSRPCSLDAPWRRLVRLLSEGFEAADVAVLDAVHVSGDRFRSYRCDDPTCCPPEGRPAARCGPAVAALVARGSAPLPSRAALHEAVQASDKARAAAVEKAARRHQARIGSCWGDLSTSRWRSWQLESLRLMQEVAGRYLAGSGALGDEEAGRIVAALCDIAVRDAAVVLLSSWGGGADGDDEPLSGPGERMSELVRQGRQPASGSTPMTPVGPARDQLLDAFWLDLATSCDGLLAVPPLTLLGVHVWTQGEGALALAAVERALRIDPSYRFARLLDEALQLGVRPTGRHEKEDDVANAVS
ncbi:MAG TPA: DUF4192 domain-containing protein [Actinomycetales bacterium]|nr:DUF4192 domain-containing protein [Actinomycetales bacterium]